LILSGSGVSNEKFDPFVHWNKDFFSFFHRQIHMPAQGCLYKRNFQPPDDTYLNEKQHRISVTKTARGNEHLANAKDYLYGVYTVVSVEEIMICA